MPDFDLIVRGDLMQPSGVRRDVVVAVTDGQVKAILPTSQAASGRQEYDFAGRYLLPGLVDSHIHSKSTQTEGIARATAAAAAGGVTTVIDMPFDSPSPITTKERV